MPRKLEPIAQEWLNSGFKALLVAVISIGIYVFNSFNKNVDLSFGALNETIKGLTAQLKIMENHQVETDKRVLAIEVSREISMTGYQALQKTVTETSQNVIQLNMRVQTIADFMASSFTKKK